MRNLSNSPFAGTLEEAIAHTLATATASIEVAGYEVTRGEERRTLAPAYDPVGFFPRIGTEVQCSGLGLFSHWTIARVAYGYTHGVGQSGLQIRY